MTVSASAGVKTSGLKNAGTAIGPSSMTDPSVSVSKLSLLTSATSMLGSVETVSGT